MPNCFVLLTFWRQVTCFCFFKLYPSSFYKQVPLSPSTDWLFSKQNSVSPSTATGNHTYSPLPTAIPGCRLSFGYFEINHSFSDECGTLPLECGNSGNTPDLFCVMIFLFYLLSNCRQPAGPNAKRDGVRVRVASI